jgi:pimeloyl-ACP methyl ester carboxylesterase
MRELGAIPICWSILCASFLAGCTNFAIEDCPKGEVLGNNDEGSARLRTSHYRVILAEPAATAARFVPYAIMSTYAYRINDGCTDRGNKVRVDPERRAELLAWLKHTADDANPWQLDPTFGTQDRQSGRIGCEDDVGLAFNVWRRTIGEQEQVVIAFRGTSGPGDWMYGNFWWFSRFFATDNQLSRARSYGAKIIRHFDSQARENGAPPPRYVVTGHSLGGTLAQHLLYTFPKRIDQAIVFDASSVTGFADPAISREDRIAGCSCESGLGPEARIIRIYQTYEVLANLRLVHKLWLPPERHVQELRFPFAASWNPISRHGMYEFTANMQKLSGLRRMDEVGQSWFASKASACTAPLIQKQKDSCAAVVPPSARFVCPQ